MKGFLKFLIASFTIYNNLKQETILYRFNQINKSKKFVPGIIMVLHTFGRSLGWNPHIHCLVTEGGSSANSTLPDDVWRKVTHFNYEAFRKSFQKVLLDLMKKKLKDVLSPNDFAIFKNLVNFLYKNFNNGFYVRAKSDFRDGKYAVKYLIRYFNRPPIASSHILFYDGDYVVFY
ncbi:MAG: transposase, partial [Bacilli bacterium]